MDNRIAGIDLMICTHSLREKSHAFHMQIMRGTHVTYMCV